MKIYNKDDVIFRQGDAGENMFDVFNGRVGIYADYGTEKERLLTEVESDTFFGEMGLIEHAPRSATAVALENGTSVIEITEDTLGNLFKKNPGRVLMLMQQLSGRLRDLTSDYKKACKTAAAIEKIEEKPQEADSETVEAAKAKAERCAAKAANYGAYL